MEQAKVGNSIIKARVDQFLTATIEHEDELVLKYGWEPSLEFE